MVLFRRTGWGRPEYETWSNQLLADQTRVRGPHRLGGRAVGRLALLHPDTTLEMVEEIVATMALIGRWPRRTGSDWERPVHLTVQDGTACRAVQPEDGRRPHIEKEQSSMPNQGGRPTSPPIDAGHPLAPTSPG